MLPFPNAHWYVGGFLLFTLAAFMPSYFAVLTDAPWVHHLHGITATLWIVLVMTQNWSAHNRKWKLHAWSGIASLALLPLFTIGGLLVTKHTLLSTSPFKDMFGHALSAADFFVSFAFVAFYAAALRYRRTPDLHARYMLATVILLAGPSLSRFFANYVPGFLIRSLDTLPKFADALDASFTIACASCLILIIRDYRKGKPVLPFSMALLGTVLMVLSYYVIGQMAIYSPFAEWFSSLASWQISAFALISSSLAVAWAWKVPLSRIPRNELSGELHPTE